MEHGLPPNCAAVGGQGVALEERSGVERKWCTRCRWEKDTGEFDFDKGGILHATCWTCLRVRQVARRRTATIEHPSVNPVVHVEGGLDHAESDRILIVPFRESPVVPVTEGLGSRVQEAVLEVTPVDEAVVPIIQQLEQQLEETTVVFQKGEGQLNGLPTFWVEWMDGVLPVMHCIAFQTCQRINLKEASIWFNEDKQTSKIGGTFHLFQIHGSLYHRQGPLLPAGGSPVAWFFQFYHYDLADAARTRSALASMLDSILILSLMQILQKSNPLIHHYVTAQEHFGKISQAENNCCLILYPQLHVVLERVADCRRENLPMADEVSMILPEEYEAEG
ncbi:hypothetical protein HOY82DRAFT_538643 [Tuber indicum]|nr:hypothetical protein HOY82DRAFT_538643 [Tuber indicum]